MKSKGYRVVSGDILQFAHFFQVARIEQNDLPSFSRICKETHCTTVQELELYLNQLKMDQGWFIEEYSEKRQFFIGQNAAHIQACINQIWQWHDCHSIDDTEYAVLIASLIQSMDKVANTAGTYYAYLKSWYRKAKKRFNLNSCNLRQDRGTVRQVGSMRSNWSPKSRQISCIWIPLIMSAAMDLITICPKLSPVDIVQHQEENPACSLIQILVQTSILERVLSGPWRALFVALTQSASFSTIQTMA